MTRKRDWLLIAARAQGALVQHHQLLAAQARAAASEAEQLSTQASLDLTGIAAEWATRRHQGAVDPALDHAYVAFHRLLSQRETEAQDKQRESHAYLDRANADLRVVHGTNRVLDELLARRELEAAATASKAELHTLTESWLLAQQHQPKDRSE